MQSLGLFVTFTSVSLTMCLTDVSEKDEIDAVVGSLVSLVWYADTDCVFSLLVLHRKQTLSIISVLRGEKEPKDFAAIVFFSGVWSHLKDKNWWICRTKEDFFSVILNWKRWMIKTNTQTHVFRVEQWVHEIFHVIVSTLSPLTCQQSEFSCMMWKYFLQKYINNKKAHSFRPCYSTAVLCNSGNMVNAQKVLR